MIISEAVSELPDLNYSILSHYDLKFSLLLVFLTPLLNMSSLYLQVESSSNSYS